MPVDPACFHGCEEILSGQLLQQASVYLERFLNAGDAQGAGVFEIVLYELAHGVCIGGLSYVVGNVNGKEIRSVHEPVHIVHVDVVGIHKVGFAVAHGHYGVIGLTTCVGGLCANYLMFTVGLVPDGNKLKRILACSLYECCQLSFSLM